MTYVAPKRIIVCFRYLLESIKSCFISFFRVLYDHIFKTLFILHLATSYTSQTLKSLLCIHASIICLSVYPSVSQSIYLPVWHQPSVCLPSNLWISQHFLLHKEAFMSLYLPTFQQNHPYSNIWWHRNLLHTQKRKFLWCRIGFIYNTAQRHEREITVSLCYHCGDKQCQWLALQWFGSFGFCGDWD